MPTASNGEMGNCLPLFLAINMPARCCCSPVVVVFVVVFAAVVIRPAYRSMRHTAFFRVRRNVAEVSHFSLSFPSFVYGCELAALCLRRGGAFLLLNCCLVFVVEELGGDLAYFLALCVYEIGRDGRARPVRGGNGLIGAEATDDGFCKHAHKRA